MRTIALRFSEKFSPECGTIAAHQQLIDKIGHVWYGKLGAPISDKVAEDILQNEVPAILLINSGKLDRHWAYITEISRETPPAEEIPAYYRENHEKFKCWFKVIAFKDAPRGIMAQCYVASSKKVLTEASKHSMSPYFIIDYEE